MDTQSLKQKLLHAMSGGGESVAKKIEDLDLLASDKTHPCALAEESWCQLCRGRGYLVESGQRGYIAARLCDCLQRCERCLGWGYYDLPDGGGTRSCTQPMPQTMVSLWNQSALPVRYLSCELESFGNFTGNGQRVQKWLGQHIDGLLAQWPGRGVSAHQQELSSLSASPVDAGGGEALGARRGVILSGGVGVGKTYLLVSLAKKLLRGGLGVKFIDFFQLISQIKAGFGQKSSEEDILRPLIDIDVLLIDELGKGRNSEFELTILDQLVMGRYNQGKPIFATTNYFLGQKAPAQTVDLRSINNSHSFGLDSFGLLRDRVGARIFSRMTEECYFISLSGQDYRELRGGRREKTL